MNTIHDENKIQNIKNNFIVDFCEYVDYEGYPTLLSLYGLKDRNFNQIPTPNTLLQWVEESMKEYAEHIREKTIDECIRLLRDENTMSEVIRETLGYGNHYSTMPVARGLVSRMEEKLKQLLT